MKRHKHSWGSWQTSVFRGKFVQIRFCNAQGCESSAQVKKLLKASPLPEVRQDRRRIVRSFSRLWNNDADKDHAWHIKVIRMILGHLKE